MKTIICNSVQSFWDMADNELLEGLDVHCVFPVTEGLKAFILNYQEKYQIRSISFSTALA
ncbi:hypothetical protein OH458_16225 [Vibrio sp. MarTm2]|jgi:hypothetical protein|uniref:Exonuclease V subunit gamma n=3 Tax=Vibrio TaxID=662 RepID=A0A0A5I059_PHOS4|nr:MULTISPECIES: hypothetical protein [Vibrio]KGY09139.1 exonuclease V subunit gamma [Vibrio sinaloensis]KHA60301.1 exonuclease V subunit gamma [Vibrio variabilis]KHD23905.1 exonuclease V subunit gamma [Vibrio caribbeanicus]KHT46144.1 exonuclease V subunit gamma [Vibrio sinaloensis]KHT49500.1 exonuclease V subunit gamma [Vibrio sinaloensis]